MGKVFFIGDVALDEYYQADYFPKIKEKIIVHTLPAQMGGSIANAACVFSALGNKPDFLTALNSGEITKKLIKGLNDAGINTEYMVYDDSIPDAKCIIILAEEEHTVFIPTLALQKIEIDEKTLEALKESDYIYTNFCEINPLSCGAKRAKDIMQEVRASGTQIWCDLDCADLSDSEASLLSYIDVAFVNEKGEENLNKRFGDNWREILFEKGIWLIIVTRAGGGCTVYQKEEEFYVPGIKVVVEDVTGAGDTFCSSFLHAYMRSHELKKSAEFANYAAARAVTGFGARFGAVSAEKILSFVEENGGQSADYKNIV